MTSLFDWLLRVRGTRRLWQAALYAVDAAVVVVATALAYYARFEGVVPPAFAAGMPWALVLACVVYLALLSVFGLYRIVLRYVGVDTALRLVAATLIGFAALFIADLLLPGSSDMRLIPFGVLFIQWLLVLLGTATVRLAVRAALTLRRPGQGSRRVLIVGAGSAGSLLLHELAARPDLGLVPVAFLDDDSELHGRTIGGVRVVGPTDALCEEVRQLRIDEVIVAMPSASKTQMRRTLNDAAECGVPTRIMPAIVIARGSVSVTDLRPVEVEDLLGRDQTPIDTEQVAETIRGKVVAVTGAAGSIGSELCRQLLPLGPARLLLLEIDETRLYELWLELEQRFPGTAEMHICDIRDRTKLDAIFGACHPEVVLHAAAYKHVPLMEMEPAEAVKTNVTGTRNVVEACEAHGAERFVLISTDKAVAPANVMGLTKALAEQITLAASARGSLLAVAVRFGNVLASRGSVVPIFEEQLRHGGPLTVTDPGVTRYFMTIPEAARLVLQAQAIGKPGDVFLLEMGEPVRIIDLARKMIALSGVPAEIQFVGLRPGEKLHESLTHDGELVEATEREKIMRVRADGAAAKTLREQLQVLAERTAARESAELRTMLAALERS